MATVFLHGIQSGRLRPLMETDIYEFRLVEGYPLYAPDLRHLPADSQGVYAPLHMTAVNKGKGLHRFALPLVGWLHLMYYTTG